MEYLHDVVRFLQDKVWENGNPYGFCHISSFIVHEYIPDSKVVSIFTENICHTFLRVNNIAIDLTFSQFKEDSDPIIANYYFHLNRIKDCLKKIEYREYNVRAKTKTIIYLDYSTPWCPIGNFDTYLEFKKALDIIEIFPLYRYVSIGFLKKEVIKYSDLLQTKKEGEYNE